MRRFAIFAAVAALTAAVATTADAGVYMFNYTGGGETGNGFFTTDASGTVVSGVGSFDFPGLGGPVIADILPGSGIDGAFIWDNLFPVDAPGLLFGDATAQNEINLFVRSGLAGVGTTFNASLYDAVPPNTQNYIGFDSGVLTITAVPEPATWAMMLLGVAMIGLAVRRRREAVAVAA
jgi:hypothetical protein